MLGSRLCVLAGAAVLAAGLSVTVASPAAAGAQQCQTAAHDNLPHVSAADAAKACKQAVGGDADACVATLQKASKGKDPEGAARAACIAAAY